MGNGVSKQPGSRGCLNGHPILVADGHGQPDTTEVAAAAHAKVISLPGGIDHDPITFNGRLRVIHSRLWAAKRSIIPDHRLCAHNYQLLASQFGRRVHLAVLRIEPKKTGPIPGPVFVVASNRY